MQLPDFPWDTLAGAAARAAAHPDGLVDLSVGTPIDPTPLLIQQALAQASNAGGYPQTWGTPALREAVVSWFARRRAVPELNPDGVLPVLGTKEFVAWLPTLLGLGPADAVAFPEIAYPTYAVGAQVAGAQGLAADGLLGFGPKPPRLLWLNSPANPTGRVLPAAHLAKVVHWARQHNVLVASDECYAELSWTGEPVPSILDPQVCGGSTKGLLAVYSLSKQSNMAGYRAGFVAGDPGLITQLLAVRKHLGMIVPAPVQAAMIAALTDDHHVAEQRERYRARREVLLAALPGTGFRVDHSEAGLYLWATRGEAALTSVDWLAKLGILAAPGSFYGVAGQQHVRIALTATDERIAAAAGRLAAVGSSA